MISKNRKQILVIILLFVLAIGGLIGCEIHRQEVNAEQRSMQAGTKLWSTNEQSSGNPLYIDSINVSKNYKHMNITLDYSISALVSLSVFDKNYSAKLVSSPKFLYKGIHLKYHFNRKNNKGILYIDSNKKLPNELLKIKLKEKESGSTYYIKVDPYSSKISK